MKISFREDGNDVLFVISDYSPEYRPVLESCFYSPEGGSSVKRFPKHVEHLDKVMVAFEQHAEEMFSQMGYLRPIPWEDALLAFIDRVGATDIDWWLTGSCATAVRGMPIKPHDVDIMLRSADIDRIRTTFGDCIVEPIVSSKGWVVDFFGVVFLHARIDLAFDPQGFVDNPDPADFGPYAMNHLERIDWKGHTIKVPPLDLQLAVNERRGRSDRVQAIGDYMAARGQG